MIDNNWMSILATALGTLTIAAFVWASYTLAQSHKRKKLLSMRKQMRAQREKELAKQHGSIRAIDLLRLNRDDDHKKQEALKLIESGNVVEGARKLELLGLQRSAISALESHYKIDEAAEMLLRMNRPNRAGVMYHRNEMPQKAAECFLLANLPEEAARSYFEAGKWDAACYRKSADLFENLGKIDQALRALLEGGHLSYFVTIAMKYECYQNLHDLMLKDQTARDVIALMNDAQIRKFIAHFTLNHDTLEHLAHWCQATHSTVLLAACLLSLDKKSELCTFFWKLFSEEFILQHIEHIFSEKYWRDFDVSEIRNIHIEALKASEHAEAHKKLAQTTVSLAAA
jgi:hypothetical protein